MLFSFQDLLTYVDRDSVRISLAHRVLRIFVSSFNRYFQVIHAADSSAFQRMLFITLLYVLHVFQPSLYCIQGF